MADEEIYSPFPERQWIPPKIPKKPKKAKDPLMSTEWKRYVRQTSRTPQTKLIPLQPSNLPKYL